MNRDFQLAVGKVPKSVLLGFAFGCTHLGKDARGGIDRANDEIVGENGESDNLGLWKFRSDLPRRLDATRARFADVLNLNLRNRSASRTTSSAIPASPTNCTFGWLFNSAVNCGRTISLSSINNSRRLFNAHFSTTH